MKTYCLAIVCATATIAMAQPVLATAPYPNISDSARGAFDLSATVSRDQNGDKDGLFELGYGLSDRLSVEAQLETSNDFSLSYTGIQIGYDLVHSDVFRLGISAEAGKSFDEHAWSHEIMIYGIANHADWTFAGQIGQDANWDEDGDVSALVIAERTFRGSVAVGVQGMTLSSRDAATQAWIGSFIRLPISTRSEAPEVYLGVFIGLNRTSSNLFRVGVDASF